MSYIRFFGVKAVKNSTKDSLLKHAPYNPHCEVPAGSYQGDIPGVDYSVVVVPHGHADHANVKRRMAYMVHGWNSEKMDLLHSRSRTW